jgi:ankyrin repeat protein
MSDSSSPENIHKFINGDINTMTKMLNEGTISDINDKGEDGVTALMAHSRLGKVHEMDFLLQNGALPNIQDNRKQTALHHAVSMNSPVAVELLLKYGADKNIKRNDGQTALDRANRLGYTECIELLEESSFGTGRKKSRKSKKSKKSRKSKKYKKSKKSKKSRN